MPTSIPSPPRVALDAATLDHLADNGWAMQDQALASSLTSALATLCRTLIAEGRLRAAGVGRGAGHAVRQDTRGDQILWLDAGVWPAADAYLAAMDDIRLTLNQSLYLGLTEHECHFAYYAPGTGYRPHLDRFRDDDARTVSAVFYLNEDWVDGQGGALRLHGNDAPLLDVLPIAGRLILFMSADMPHEVLPATRDRLSIAGWFRRRSQ